MRMTSTVGALLALLSAYLALPGCSSAPKEVIVADEMAERELAVYVENTDSIMLGIASSYQQVGVREAEFAHKMALDVNTDESNMIDRAKADEALKARDEALASIATEYNKFLDGMARAKLGLRHYYDLKQGVKYYLEKKGIDPSAIPEMTSALLGEFLKRGETPK